MSRDVHQKDQDFGGFRAINAADAVGAQDLVPLHQVPTAGAITWEHVSTNRFRLPQTQAGETVQVRLQGNPVGSVAAIDGGNRLVEVAGRATDARADEATIGVAIGIDSSSDAPLLAMPGDVTITGLGVQARIVPILFQTHYVQFDGTGTAPFTTRFGGVHIPHIALTSINGPVHIGDVYALCVEAGPDINPQITADRSWNTWFQNDQIRVDDGIDWGRNGGAFEAVWGGGGVPPVSDAGSVRRRYNSTSHMLELSAEGEAWRPQTVAYQSPTMEHDPGARTYPTGDTDLHTFTVADSGKTGMGSFVPAIWELPPAINVSGGQLQTGIRFVFANGSPSVMPVNDSTIDTLVGSRAFNLLGIGDRITSMVVFVRNTSGSTSSSQDIGQFALEGVFL